MLDLKTQLNDTKRITVPTQELKILASDIIQIGGSTRTKMSKQAFKDLLDIIGLNQKTIDHLNVEIEESAGYNLAKVLMQTMAQKKGLVVDLLVSTTDGEVKRIATEGMMQAGLNPIAFEDLINYGIDKSGGKLIMTDQFVTDGGTKSVMNFKWDEPISLKFKGEEICSGKQLVYDLLGPTSFGDMIERLVCTNGMTTTSYGNFHVLNVDSNPHEWYKFLFEDLRTPKREKIEMYEKRVLDAMQTNLSVFEYNKLAGHCFANWKDDNHHILRYFGDQKRWENDYKKAGIDLSTLTAGQLRNCPTPVNAWDAINCLTDLSSHQYNTPVGDDVRRKTQRFAGAVLESPWDAEAQVIGVPQYN